MHSLTIVGGLVPMIPYFAMADVTKALYASIAITVVVLLVFGYTKGHLTVRTKRAEFCKARRVYYHEWRH